MPSSMATPKPWCSANASAGLPSPTGAKTSPPSTRRPSEPAQRTAVSRRRLPMPSRRRSGRTETLAWARCRLSTVLPLAASVPTTWSPSVAVQNLRSHSGKSMGK